MVKSGECSRPAFQANDVPTLKSIHSCVFRYQAAEKTVWRVEESDKQERLQTDDHLITVEGRHYSV
jgi:hypothetical protein